MSSPVPQLKDKSHHRANNEYFIHSLHMRMSPKRPSNTHKTQRENTPAMLMATPLQGFHLQSPLNHARLHWRWRQGSAVRRCLGVMVAVCYLLATQHTHTLTYKNTCTRTQETLAQQLSQRKPGHHWCWVMLMTSAGAQDGEKTVGWGWHRFQRVKMYHSTTNSWFFLSNIV